ncbi:hypothetical protein BT69DRAFT_1198784, partial [Atractiella rhizophila]
RPLRKVSGHPINGVWGELGPQIRDLLKEPSVPCPLIDAARFLTHSNDSMCPTLGPVIVWIGVPPDSLHTDKAVWSG